MAAPSGKSRITSYNVCYTKLLRKERCDAGFGVGSTGLAVFLDFKDAINRLGKDVIEAKYGNLFQMYEKITDKNPMDEPMMIYPAVHYTMGGLWVDYVITSYSIHYTKLYD